MSQNHSRSKQAVVIQELIRMSEAIGPGNKLPTAQKLAQQFGVTLTTLDRSLSKLEAKGIIVRRQGSGIYVSKHALDKRVGLVFGRNIFQVGSSAFYLILLQLCEKRAALGHEQFSFFLSNQAISDPENEPMPSQGLFDALKQERLDGLILCEFDHQKHEETIHSYGLPTVALAPSYHFPTVGIDAPEIIRLGVTALAEQGCRSIGQFGILSKHEETFRKICQEQNLRIEENWMMHPADEADPPFDMHESMGHEWVRSCLQKTPQDALPDGIMITDDILARGACFQFRESGLRVGRDIRIATHANKGSLALEYWQDELTLVEVDPKQLVDCLFDQLESLMNGKKLVEHHTSIKPTLHAPTKISDHTKISNSLTDTAKLKLLEKLQSENTRLKQLLAEEFLRKEALLLELDKANIE